MKKTIVDESLFAIRTLIVVLCVICGTVPAWAGHDGPHYAKVTVTATPTGQGKVYMTTDGDYLPESEDWQNSMSATWNCNDGVDDENDTRTYYVHAQPTSGNHFVKWSSNSSGSDSKSTDAKYAYETSAKNGSSGSPTANNIYAIFEVNPTYTCTMLTSENGTYKYKYGDSEEVTVESQHSVTTNQNFTFTALPEAGYTLYGWYTKSGETKTYFDYTSTTISSYALPGNISIGVDFVPVGTPIFQIKGSNQTYTDLNAAISACGAATKTIVLINNGTLPAENYTIPANVTLLIPFDEGFTCYTTTPALTTNSFLIPEVYRTLTMSPGATLTVNGAISVSAKLSSRSGYGPNGATSGKYGAIKMLSGGNTKSKITLNSGAKLYGWGYIYGEGAIEALSGSTVYEGFDIMDWRGGNNTLDMYDNRNTYKVFPFNQYYIQNIEVPLTLHKGATESVYSSVYGNGSDNPLSITMVGESSGLFRLTGTGAKLTKWYDPLYDRQHYELEGAAAINAISFTAMGMTVSSSAFVLPITNNMVITVRSGATVSIAEDVCIMPDASITVEEGATMTIAKNVYVYDIQACTNAGTYTTNRGGYPSAGPGRYAAGAYVRRISYSPSWAALSDREIRRLQNMSSAHFQVNGTLNVSGKLYTTEGGADIFSTADGAVVNLATGAGTANKTYQVDHENYDAYYYTIPVTSALLHNADGSYQATAGNAANTAWTYAHDHWGWCIIWRLEDGTELKRMYQPAQPNADWISSNAPETSKPDEGTCSFVFNGWNTVANTSQQEIILTADYTKTCEEYYDVLWKSEDGTETYETDENVGQGETTRYNGAAPVKADDEANGFTYTFDGWTTEPNGGGTKYNIGETPAATGDATYYAHFAATEVAATVTANGVVSYYPSIEDAFTAANASDYTPTIQVWRDAPNTPALTYTAKNHCTLDLNGHTVSGTEMPLLTINDEGFTFTVTDRTETKEGKLAGTSGASTAFVVSLVSGVFRLEAGTVYGQNTGTGVMAGVYAGANREVIMTGGTIQVDANSGTGYGIFAQGKGTINGGTIRVESSAKSVYAVQAQGAYGNVTVTDGKFYAAGSSTGTVTCVIAKGGASLTVNGGYYNTAANLETYKAATCRVYSLPSTKLPYRYTVTEKTPLVASVTINSVTTEYSSFADAWSAVNSASAASTLKLLDDVDVTTQLTYDNNNNKNCTLDLNGHTLTSNTSEISPLHINNANVTFTITDGTEEKSGKLSLNTSSSSTIFGVYVQYGAFRLEGGTIEVTSSTATACGVTIHYGTFTMNGGTIHVRTTNGKEGRGIYANATTTVNGGTVHVEAAGTAYGIRHDAGTMTINDGKFSISGSTAYMNYKDAADNKLIIKGGYYNIDTRLGTYVSAPYHVLDLTSGAEYEEGYRYKVAEAYTLSWSTDGELSGEGYTPAGLTAVGTPIEAPTSTKEGYVFAGWTPSVAETMPAANTSYTATWAVASVTINGNTTLYTDFNTAFTAANGSAAYPATIKLLQNTTIGSTLQYTNSNYQNCTLDLNGYTISSAKQFALRVNSANASFTITDGSANQDGKLLSEPTKTDQAYGVYIDKGTFVLQAGTVEAHLKAEISAGVRAVNANAYFTMNGGTLHVETADGKTAHAIYSAGTATVTNGKIYVTGSTAYVTNQAAANANVVIQGGKYNTDAQLETCISAPYHKFSLADESPYMYKVAEGYTVTFNANGHGSAPEAQLIEKNAHANEPTAPTATGYTFGGWYKEAACETPWNFASDVVTTATTLFAKWTLNTYTINYELNGGTESPANPTTYNVETATFTLNNPTKEGYTFLGWTGSNGSTPQTAVNIANGSTGNKNYTANWAVNVASVTINSTTRYYTTLAAAWTAVNTATAASTLTLLQDVTVTTELTYNNSNNKNCTFDLNGHILTSNTSEISPLHINNTNVTFTVTDGTEEKAGKLSLNSSSSSTIFGAYVKYGTLQLNAGTIEVTSSTATACGVTIHYGTFTMNGGTIHVNTDNGKEGRGVYSAGTATVNGGTVHVEAAGRAYGIRHDAGTMTINDGKFTISGSTESFINYTDAADSKLIIKGGYYTINSRLATYVSAPYHVFDLTSGTEFDEGYRYKVAEGYTVTFKNEDETLQSGLWEKGTTPVYAGTTPTKAATAQYTYTFDDWSPTITPVTANATYTAQFSSTVNIYTVTWKNADGTTLETDENVPYGTTPEYNGATPTKATDAEYAYTFNTWSPAVSAVTGDATYTATYTTTPVVASVTVNSTTAYYTSFADAWTAATGAGSASTLTLLGDVAGLASSRTYSASHDLMLDLNGHTLSGSSAETSMFQVNCTGHTFTVTDGSANHDGKLSFSSGSGSTSHCVIMTNGTFVLEAGMMEATSSTASIGAVQVNSGTVFTMNENGAVHANYTGNVAGKNSRALHANGGTTTINGGTIHLESTKDGIGVVYGSGNVTFNGGKFKIVVSGTAAVTNKNSAQTNLNIRGGYYSANDNSYFTPHVKSPYHIFANADAEYPQKVAEGYTVTFNNYDDTSLQSGVWEKGATPAYRGATPTKPADAHYTYTFDTWSPEISSVTANATYTAQYSSTVNKYTVIFKNGDEVLQSSEVEYGATPAYTGSTPTKAATAQYTYAFSGWDPAISEITADAVYTARFSSIPKPQEDIVVNPDETVTVSANTAITTTTVHVEGLLNVEDNVTLTTNDLILEATPSSSGEILGNVEATNAYFDLSQPGGFKARTWYAVAVPWQVEAPAYALGDVSLSNDGENYTPQTLGVTFDLIYYDGARRANGASKAWNYVEDDSADKQIMLPGRAYMIYLTTNTNVIRFRKSTSAALHKNTLAVYEYDSDEPKDASWNGIANPATYYAYINANVKDYTTGELNVGQVYNAESKTYSVVDMNANNMVVGQPVFVQATATNESVMVYADHDDAFHPAPRRAQAQVTPLIRYQVVLAQNDDQVADRIIVRMDEDKETDAYTVGQDLAKMGVSTVVPQMWVNRYNTQLCVNTTSPTYNRADYPLALFAPAAGEYTIAITGDPTLVNNDAMLYLTYDGKAVWNLNYAPYSLTMEGGTNTHYGLRIVYAPQVTTDLENGAADNVPCTKVLMDDHVFIIRGGRMYSIDGQWVK